MNLKKYIVEEWEELGQNIRKLYKSLPQKTSVVVKCKVLNNFVSIHYAIILTLEC